MSVAEYINSDVFVPVYGNGLPELNAPSVRAICSELYFTIKANEEIFVYGDYDMDGFCCNLVWEEVLSVLYDVPVKHFQYSTRQHTVDRDILRQVGQTRARVVIICDSGSGSEDHVVVNTLCAHGYTPIVIDHHVYEGDYDKDSVMYKMYNSYEERGLLGGAEVSGAYASLLVAAVLCKNYFHRPVPFNALTYALGSMYADVVDMATAPGRALYNMVTSTKLQGPGLLIAMNPYRYGYTRRFFSFHINNRINACFRSETFSVLNRALTSRDRYVLNSITEDFKQVHVNTKRTVELLLPQFKRERFGGIVLAIHEVTDETLLLHVRNFSGLLAGRIARDEKSLAIVVIKNDGVYSGSFRDFHNRKLLDTFRVFCNADGHDQAFGLSFVNLADFRRHLMILSRQLEVSDATDFILIPSHLVQTRDDVDALALYNEYMNVQPSIQISHRCPYAKLLRSTTYRKFYNVGLPDEVQSANPLVEGSNILIEPCITSAIELRCVD